MWSIKSKYDFGGIHIIPQIFGKNPGLKMSSQILDHHEKFKENDIMVGSGKILHHHKKELYSE